ncbi:MAG: IS66 family insertion sequence element accessory protein TnpB [Bacilli bacterium]|nr:IS66 family insertion sequence element accessory protein TnpB [Bacilli bacterium]
MIDLNSVKNIHVACGYTDLRKDIDGYASIADGKLKLNPFDNVLFIFCNRAKNKIKILHYKAGSFWLYPKFYTKITTYI